MPNIILYQSLYLMSSAGQLFTGVVGQIHSYDDLISPTAFIIIYNICYLMQYVGSGADFLMAFAYFISAMGLYERLWPKMRQVTVFQWIFYLLGVTVYIGLTVYIIFYQVDHYHEWFKNYWYSDKHYLAYLKVSTVQQYWQFMVQAIVLVVFMAALLLLRNFIKKSNLSKTNKTDDKFILVHLLVCLLLNSAWIALMIGFNQILHSHSCV